MQKKKILIFLSVIILIYSCGNENNNERDLLEIPVDIDQKGIPFPFNEITEGEITAIELELTDESVLGGVGVALLCNDYIIIIGAFPFEDLFVFSMEGKFIRKINYKGQGPGELSRLNKIAVDEKENHLYMIGNKKIVCYDLNGKFLKEFTSLLQEQFILSAMNFVNNELLILGDRYVENAGENYKQSVLYKLNHELQLLDSYTIKSERLGEVVRYVYTVPAFDNYLCNIDSAIYLYCPEHLPLKETPKLLRDTLYRFENNRLIPELKLKFKYSDNNLLANKNLRIRNIFRSSRYVFIDYTVVDWKTAYLYCYDLKTKKAYNVDLSPEDNTDLAKHIFLRQFYNNSDMFYYTLTHISPDDLEEPNPTLYIGKFKK